MLGVLSPGGPSGRLSILIFHRVLRVPDPLLPDEPCAHRFDQICSWLQQWFNVLPLDIAVERLHAGDLPPRSLAITFDDGYTDNHDVAMPILRKRGLTATFFVATDFLDGGRMWNDTLVESVRRCRLPELDLSGTGLALKTLPLTSLSERLDAIAALIGTCRYLEPLQRKAMVESIAVAAGAILPDDLMMTSAKVMALHRAGMGIGGHTLSHPILARLPAHEALREMQNGKACLENLVQAPVTMFAYPNGRPGSDYTAEHADLAKEVGFKAAVSTAWGVADRSSHPFQLPRFTPWNRSRWAFGFRLAQNAMRPVLTA